MSQMLKLSAPISELRPVVAALRFDSFRSAMHDIHDITDREPCERLAMHQLTAGESAVGQNAERLSVSTSCPPLPQERTR